MKITFSNIFPNKIDAQKQQAVINDIYNRALTKVNNIPKQKIEKVVKCLFKQTGEINSYIPDLIELLKLAKEVECPDNIKEDIQSFLNEAKILVKKSENNSVDSKKTIIEQGYIFLSKNEEKSKKIYDYFNDKYCNVLLNRINGTNKKLSDDLIKKYERLCELSKDFHLKRFPLDLRISELPKGILPENGKMYHGTKKAKKIMKTGFSTHYSKQIHIASREFGDGIYLTPEKEVASFFADITGRIMPVYARVKRTAFVESENFREMCYEVNQLAQEAGIEIKKRNAYNNAVRELIINRLFREAGYDSVYAANGMVYGLNIGSVDDILGRPQSQLVVFDSDKIVLAGKKNFIEKLKDEIMQIKSYIKCNSNEFKIALKNHTRFI